MLVLWGVDESESVGLIPYGAGPAHVLGMWSPGSALRFVTDIGAALPTSGYPDLAVLGEVYRRHHSELAV